MANALFVTEQYIKDNTPIDGNVDAKYLHIAIHDAQRMHILPIIGTGLYNEIAGQIVSGTVSANNRSLLDNYIQDALKYWVLVEAVDLLSYKYTNKATATKSSDNSQPVEQDDVVRLIARNKDRAEFFSQRITNFLIANSDTYPLYINAGTDYDTVQPIANNYETGLSLDDDDYERKRDKSWR